MKKKYSYLALLCAFVLAFSGAKAYGWGSASGDASDYRQLQETAVFFNNSGKTLVAGDVVILDTARAGVATGTTLGAYISTTLDGHVPAATAADNVLVVGVVKSTSIADQRPIVVVTKGPALTLCDDSADAVSNYTAVGTSGSNSERCGGGTNLGIALEPGDGTDDDEIIIWVSPTGAD